MVMTYDFVVGIFNFVCFYYLGIGDSASDDDWGGEVFLLCGEGYIGQRVMFVLD